jgi:hypothetical protein
LCTQVAKYKYETIEETSLTLRVCSSLQLAQRKFCVSKKPKSGKSTANAYGIFLSSAAAVGLGMMDVLHQRIRRDGRRLGFFLPLTLLVFLEGGALFSFCVGNRSTERHFSRVCIPLPLVNIAPRSGGRDKRVSFFPFSLSSLDAFSGSRPSHRSLALVAP